MLVTEIMKRRGNILNSEEFTGVQPSRRAGTTTCLPRVLLSSREAITWNGLDCCWSDFVLDVERYPALVVHCRLRLWRSWVVLLCCLQQYADHDI
jgi:hypothetical protein